MVQMLFDLNGREVRWVGDLGVDSRVILQRLGSKVIYGTVGGTHTRSHGILTLLKLCTEYIATGLALVFG